MEKKDFGYSVDNDKTTISLAGTPVIDNDAVYLVDWSKLQSIDELILLLASIGFSFSPRHPQFQTIKHLLALNQPIKIGQQQPEQKELKLPKLKTIKGNGN
jgi:hypothetical protein